MADKTPSKGEGRRTERVFLRIPVEVKGKGPEGKPFQEKTFTLVVNRDGARISLNNTLRPGDELSITNLQTKISCPFRVVHRTSDTLGEGAPEWGVQCLEPEVNFWGINFPRKTPATMQPELVDALLECAQCHSRELAQLALEQYRELIGQSSLTRNCVKCNGQTLWSFGFVEVEAQELEDVPAQQPVAAAEGQDSSGGAERRRAKRVTVKLPVRIRLEDGREEIARTENLSKTGVCFSSDLSMQEGELLRLTVGYSEGSHEAEVMGRVVWRRPLQDKTGPILYGIHLEESR